MLRSMTQVITVAANGEELEAFFTCPKGVKRTVKYIAPEITADGHVRGYIEQDRVIDASMDADCFAANMIPADVIVNEGQTFRAGFYDLSGAGFTADLTILFTEETTN